MNLSNASLHEKLVSLAAQEREITLQVLHHLREAEARKLFAFRGHSSLFDYAVQELKYSEGSAQRRISAMRLLKELPDLEEKVESGELKVTQLSQVQSFLRAEAKVGQSYSTEAKRDLVLATIGKSTREVVQELSPNTNESVSVSPEAMTALLQARDRFAHELPHGASLSDVIGFLAERALKSDPMKNAGRRTAQADQRAENSPEKGSGDLQLPPALAVKETRFIPVGLKRVAWGKEGEGCAFVSPVTGKRCGSRHRLQIDHIVPFALGGSSRDVKNLRLLCAVHNRAAWESRRTRNL